VAQVAHLIIHEDVALGVRGYLSRFPSFFPQIGLEMVALPHGIRCAPLPAAAGYSAVCGGSAGGLGLAQRFAKVVTSAQYQNISSAGCKLVIRWNHVSGASRGYVPVYQGGFSALPLVWGGN
jgi:hypothetical protein